MGMASVGFYVQEEVSEVAVPHMVEFVLFPQRIELDTGDEVTDERRFEYRPVDSTSGPLAR
jgi:hypothetical protein